MIRAGLDKDETNRARLALWTLPVPAFLWFLMFGLRLGNFWAIMSVAAVILIGFTIVISGMPVSFKELKAWYVVLGIVLAIVLYFIFYVGDLLSSYMFPFAKKQVSGIYTIRQEGNPWLVALLLLLLTGPAEEVYWRGLVQRYTTKLFGRTTGFWLTTILYTGIHVTSLNFMLIMSAFVAGLFWGGLYRSGLNLWPILISHAVWGPLIFVVAPIT